MIGFLEGEVAGRTEGGCFLKVGGVGYRLSCSATTLRALPPAGGRARLWTVLHVRDDALVLYGFVTEAEQSLFEALVTVSSVGPKVALAVCSAYPPEALRGILATGDVDSLSTIPGIGKKIAARIVLELKEKLALPDLDIVTDGERAELARARSALENLSYSSAEIRSALARLEPSESDGVEDLIRKALRVLAEERRRA
ncbi:MAG TPA: Holliday junction branch migration protein RuvA [Actinomycetota bacterium]|nr:Holliday junction branch migration protein RuvA [Actinomycetota bacterium]